MSPERLEDLQAFLQARILADRKAGRAQSEHNFGEISGLLMRLEEVLKFIAELTTPYNNNHWNQNIWKQSLLHDLEKEWNKRCSASSSASTTDNP